MPPNRANSIFRIIMNLSFGKGDASENKPFAYFLDRLAFPKLIVLLFRHDRLLERFVGVERAVQMVDLVLKDPGVPALRADDDRLSPLVQTFDADRCGPRDNPQISRNAQARFEEGDGLGSFEGHDRINDDMEGN